MAAGRYPRSIACPAAGVVLRWLAGENFDNDILRALFRRKPGIDAVRAQDVGLTRIDDEALLAWAAEQGRIVLTHDRQTMPKHAYDRVRSHQPMPGLIVVSDRMPVGEAIELLAMHIDCGMPKDFEYTVTYIP